MNTPKLTSLYGFGKAHHRHSADLYAFIAHVDFNEGHDAFGFKSGGDGDNGEMLMDLFDVWFHTAEAESSCRREYLYAKDLEAPCEECEKPQGAHQVPLVCRDLAKLLDATFESGRREGRALGPKAGGL